MTLAQLLVDRTFCDGLASISPICASTYIMFCLGKRIEEDQIVASDFAEMNKQSYNLWNLPNWRTKLSSLANRSFRPVDPVYAQ